jgi:LAO/AO transport system kinase
VVKTAATTGQGTDELLGAIESFAAWLSSEGRLKARRAEQWRERIAEMVRTELLRQMRRSGVGERELRELAARVADGVENPYLALPGLMKTR